MTEISIALYNFGYCFFQCHTVTLSSKPETDDGSNDDDVVDLSSLSSDERPSSLRLLHPRSRQPARTAPPAQPPDAAQRAVEVRRRHQRLSAELSASGAGLQNLLRRRHPDSLDRRQSGTSALPPEHHPAARAERANVARKVQGAQEVAEVFRCSGRPDKSGRFHRKFSSPKEIPDATLLRLEAGAHRRRRLHLHHVHGHLDHHHLRLL